HVRLREGDRGTGLQGDDVHVHVVAQVGRVDEPLGAPRTVGADHADTFHVLGTGDEGGRHLDPVGVLVGLADPVEAGFLAGAVVRGPVRTRGQVGVPAGG